MENNGVLHVFELSTGDALRVGDDILVCYLGKCHWKRASEQENIGVEAPPEVRILREELLKKDKVKNTQATQEDTLTC